MRELDVVNVNSIFDLDDEAKLEDQITLLNNYYKENNSGEVEIIKNYCSVLLLEAFLRLILLLSTLSTGSDKMSLARKLFILANVKMRLYPIVISELFDTPIGEQIKAKIPYAVTLLESLSEFQIS